MNLNENDNAMREVLKTAKVIAVVGHSERPDRPSYRIAQFLRAAGYTVYPINPTVTEIDGKISYPTLKHVPEKIDIVDVFRRSFFLNTIFEEAIAVGAKTVWGQLGVADLQAAKKAIDAGLNIAMDVCIKIEYQRLGLG